MRIQEEDGFTLIEVLVVLGIISVLMTVSVGMFTAIFNANIRGNKVFAQQSSLETASGFFTARLGTTEPKIGRHCTTASTAASTASSTRCVLASGSSEGIDPLSIAGDQLVFVSNGQCFRAAYIQRLKQIRVASAPASDGLDASTRCDNVRVKPIRGPNEKLNNGSFFTNVSPTHPRCDSMLDGITCTGYPAEQSWYILSENITPTPPASHSSTDTLQMFTYRDGAGNVISGFDATANGAATVAGANGQTATSHNTTAYGRTTVRDSIASVDLTMFMEAPAGGPNVNTKVLTKKIFLGQPGTSATTGTSSTSSQEVFVGLNTSTGSNSVPERTDNPVLVKADAADTTNLRTTAIPSQEAWLNVKGYLTVWLGGNVSNPHAVAVKIRLQLYRNDVAITSSGGYKDMIFEHTTDNPVSDFFEANFKIPVGTADTTSDSYKVGLLINNPSTKNPVLYSTNANEMELAVSVIPR